MIKLRSVYKVCAILSAICCSYSVQAQYAVNWLKQMGGTGEDWSMSVATDAAGNVYQVGTFTGNLNYYTGSNTIALVSNGNTDIYITKSDISGNLVWARSIGGPEEDNGYGIAADEVGNVYVTGYFKGTADFNPGTGTYPLTSSPANTNDVFILKLDAAGSFVWAKPITGGSGNNLGKDIKIDRWGNLLVTGNFMQTVEFNSGGPSYTLTSLGDWDVFVAKYTPGGNLIWGKQMGGTSSEEVSSLSIDTAGNVYTTGNFRNTADFNPGSGIADTFKLRSNGNEDIFISKLDSAGRFVWARSIGGKDRDMGYGIATDDAGNVYTTGLFTDIVNFDPGTGTALLSRTTGYDAFVSKLDADGDFVWAKQIGGPPPAFYYGTSGHAIAVDKYGYVYTTGLFFGTADLDPGTADFKLSSRGIGDAFISKLSPDGNYAWAAQLGGSGNDQGQKLTVDASGNLYVAGNFSTTANFHPGNGTLNLSAKGETDVFLLKLFCSDTSTTRLNASANCEGYLFQNEKYTQTGVYPVKLLSRFGCDSTVILDLAIQAPEAIINVNGFQLSTTQTFSRYQWYFNNNLIQGATGATYTVSQNGNYTVAVTDENGCSDTSAIYVVSNVTSISDYAAIAEQINVYPIPSDNFISISSPISLNATLSSLEGRIVLQRNSATSFSIKQLSKGIYLLHLTDKLGNLVKVQKIVKQ